MTAADITSRRRGCLLGLACGDAVGTTVEFRSRGSFSPVTDMTGGGPFGLPVGAWTDDTSMALCLGHSLIEREGFDAIDQMNRYCRWHETGYMSSTGKCFDIGTTVRGSLSRFKSSGKAMSGLPDPKLAGNGCIMRLAPVPLYYHPDEAEAVRWAGESARTTHGAAECVEASQLLASILCRALSVKSKDDILFGHDPAKFTCPKVRMIAEGRYRTKSESAIFGTGYVIDCLEASAWCFMQTSSFRDAVLLAVNLGDDADTTGAVVGQIAGAFYGVSEIPEKWLAKLVMADEILSLADRLGPPRNKESPSK